MNNQLPLITIGITCFNSEDTILRALDSAISQTYPNIEVIVVDDCSSDSSVRMIGDFVRVNTGVKLIVHQENAGMAGALNTIISNANGLLVAWFDDDDVSLPHRIQTQYDVISKYNDANDVLVGCWCSTRKKYSNGHSFYGTAIGSRKENPKGLDILDYHLNMDTSPTIFFGSGTPACSLMTYTEVFSFIGSYDTNLRRTDDTDFAIRLGLSGGHFIGTDKVLVEQYWSCGSDKAPKVELDSQVRLLEKYRDRFRSSAHFDFAMRWRKIRFFYFSQNRLGLFKATINCILTHPILSSKRLKNGFKRILHDRRISK
jgi:glycosyltransferase involved in cell wall biosynthesis